MISLLSVSAFGFFGFGLGAVAGRDLARMATALSGPGIRGAVAWGLGKRLALFSLALALGASQGPAGVAAAAAGYTGGFAVLAFKQGISLGR